MVIHHRLRIHELTRDLMNALEKYLKMFPENIKLKNFGIVPIYRLRWRYDYKDGKTLWGGWNWDTEKPGERAVDHLREGLILASIEGQVPGPEEPHRLTSISGQDFIQFKWLKAGYMTLKMKAGEMGAMTEKKIGRVYGMSVVGRYQTIDVLVDGWLDIRPTTPRDRMGFIPGWRV